jgi:Family of unknown function (DUF6325)
MEATMTLGPLEYTVIGFEGNRFNGEIAKEIGAVVDAGIIALVDVVMITKDIDGNAAVVEIDAKDDPRFAGFAGMLEGLMGLLTPEDIDNIAAGLPANTSALVLLFEHRWAVNIKEAIGAAGGFLISRTTVAPEILELVNAELEAEAITA